MAYNDGEMAEALIMLWSSKYDYDRVSEETGISTRTLRRWDKNAPKSIPDLLERAIMRLLMAIPKDMHGSQWSTAVGILFDKWLLIQGEPTSRTETIERRLDDLGEDEYSDVIKEAEAIIRAASSS